MRAGNIPVISHSRTMEISLSVFCAVVISLLFSDCAIMTAATHVSPLSSGYVTTRFGNLSRFETGTSHFATSMVLSWDAHL